MTFNVTCSPGPDAAAGYMRVVEHLPALVIYLDPVNVAIQLPPFPGGDVVLAKFCRELAREAAKLAAAVDPDGEPAPPERAPRHLLITGDDGDSGGGY
jgi:hypothetical protein